MALEIERRFLVRGDGWRPHVRWQARLRQGYLVAADDGLVVRVRTRRPEAGGGAAAWLTLKAPPPRGAASCTRLEFEYPIPPGDGEALLALAPDQLVKLRHGLDLPGGEWVLDVFEGRNAPLVVAEVELDDEDRSPPVPAWCVRELTGLHQLSNAALAQRPLQAWSEAERAALMR
ncbi:MAG: CYTH domain-containing protein [Synechococcaceae cyanobacterium]|nr:CYTH domain-containing protein [Synechococcaceae cyanobacterium]